MNLKSSKHIFLLITICFGVAYIVSGKINFSGKPKSPVNKMTQVRIFTINKGKMDVFVDAWLKGVYPLRIKTGFKIEGAWVVREKNKFIWILSYDGPEGFVMKDSLYYASQNRKAIDPDPAQYIADAENYFINSVIP